MGFDIFVVGCFGGSCPLQISEQKFEQWRPQDRSRPWLWAWMLPGNNLTRGILRESRVQRHPRKDWRNSTVTGYWWECHPTSELHNSVSSLSGCNGTQQEGRWWLKSTIAQLWDFQFMSNVQITRLLHKGQLFTRSGGCKLESDLGPFSIKYLEPSRIGLIWPMNSSDSRNELN